VRTEHKDTWSRGNRQYLIAALARLDITGGDIRHIALNAPFLAADESAPNRMRHLLRATDSECAKTDKPLTEAEIGGWQ
jgi:hypothetical protein